MNKKQWQFFLYILCGFCIVATISLGAQGAFNNIDSGGAAILFSSYLIVAAILYIFIKKNPENFN